MWRDKREKGPDRDALVGRSRRRSPVGVRIPPSDHDAARFTRYDDWIRQAATLYQIPEQLVRAIIRCESDYDPRAVSVSGARGPCCRVGSSCNLI